MIKTTRADLEKERTMFFLLGFTVILATLFVLLEWQSDELDYNVSLSDIPMLFIGDDWMETPAADIETKIATSEPEAITSDNELSQSIVYEDFNIVENAVDTEEILRELFDVPVLPDDLPKELTEQEKELLIEQIYTEAEIMPQFPGGYTALNRFIFTRLKYPASAYTQRIEGRVWCSFVVERDGTVSNIQVERGIYISLDQEVLLVLQQMPHWTAGSIRGEKVRMKVYLPIVFKI